VSAPIGPTGPGSQVGPEPDEWLSLQPPIWVPFLWWAALAGSIVVSMVGDPAPACSVQSPCEPDRVFPMVVALTGISAAAMWWFPITALAAGAVYAVLGVLFDPSYAGRYAEAVAGCLALGLMLTIRALRFRQAVVAGRDSTAEPEPMWAHQAGQRRHAPLGWTSAVVLAVGAMGLGLLVASIGGYVHQTDAERAHVARAGRAEARVVTYTDDSYRQVFAIESGTRTGDRVRIEVIDELSRGSVWPVLVDPKDPTWVRLVSEPKDFTSWFGWALLGAVMALWSLGREVARVRTRELQTPVSVHRIRLTRSGIAELTLAAGAQPVAAVSLAGTSDAQRTGAPQPAVVRGRVADGSWVSIQTETGVLPVAGPLRANQRWRDLSLATTPLEGRAAGLWDRLHGVGLSLWRVFLLGLGCFLAWMAVHQASPAWAAAHERGIPGVVTVTSEDCGGKGGCHYAGDFHSTTGGTRSRTSTLWAPAAPWDPTFRPTTKATGTPLTPSTGTAGEGWWRVDSSWAWPFSRLVSRCRGCWRES
jgi:hypothetical protein